MTGKPEDEYTEVLASYRHYSNLRFTILGVFAALFVGLIAIATGTTSILPSPYLLRTAQWLLLLLSVVFWAFEEGIDCYLRAFGQRINVLEESLGYHHLSSRPRWSIWIAIPATRAPYLLGVLLSIAVLYYGVSPPAAKNSAPGHGSITQPHDTKQGEPYPRATVR